MTGNEVRQMSDEEIRLELVKTRRSLFDLRHKAVSEKITDNAQFRNMRRDVARMLTEQTARRNAKAAKA